MTSINEPASVLGEGARPKKLVTSARGPIVAGLLVILVVFVGLGGWAAVAPLASAVTAPATVISQGRVRIVQHLEGGIVASINVQEGQRVEQGSVLFTLDPVQVTARAQRLRSQLDALTARAARLRAEVVGADEVAFPDDLLQQHTPLVGEIVGGETALFYQRKQSLAGQISLLEQRVAQLEADLSGLQIQRVAKEDQLQIANTEYERFTTLLNQQLIQQSRLLAVERERVQLVGEIGELISAKARADESIAEAKLQMLQREQEFREQAAAELRDVETQISDVEQQWIAATDILNRLHIVAPETGTVQNLAVTTQGAVISPGQALLEIAPETGEMLIEARISPIHAHEVHAGLQAEVRFVSLNLRRMLPIYGTLETVSGDRLVDPRTGTDYFLAQVRVKPEEMSKLNGQRVTPGMPAEIVVETGERTALEYIIQPLTEAISHGLKER